MSLMWMPAADHAAALGHGAQRRRHELPGGSEDERGVELLGRRAQRVARPLGPQAQRELLPLAILRAREGEHPPALVARPPGR